MIVDKAPTINVAIGVISLKNSASFGDWLSMGCVTKTKEYKTIQTIKNKIIANIIPITNRKSESGLFTFFIFGLYQIFGASSKRNTIRLLAFFFRPIFGTLAIITKTIFATMKPKYKKNNEQMLHALNPFQYNLKL